MKFKRVLFILFAIIFIIFLFVELFIYRIIDLPFPFQLLAHYENRADVLSFINIIVSTGLSFAIYILSKKIDRQTNAENKRKRYEAICNIYDYLNEAILYVKKKVFKEREDYRELAYNKDFIKYVYSLNDDLFDQDDIELLREVDKSLRHFLSSNNKFDSHFLSIKWVYKSLFDLNIPVDEVDKINNIVDDDMILNNQLIMILCKLRKELKYNYEKKIQFEKKILNIEKINNEIVISKEYGMSHVTNGKGFLEIYEPVFFEKNSGVSFKNGGLLYKGKVYKYKPHGVGKYYYYYERDNLVSNTLIEDNAKKITKILSNDGLDGTSNFVVEGTFVNGIIKSGLVKSDDDNYNNILI